MTAPALVLEHVSRRFGGLRAVDDVALTVAPGERHAVIGPNGAGKTTLFNLISGELAPTTGRIVLFGTDITRLPPYQRAALGIARTFQITKLFPGLTVLENVLLASEALVGLQTFPQRPLYKNRFFYVKAIEKRLQAGYNEPTMAPRKKNPHAVALGRLGGKKGGKKGGKARWEGVPPEERSEILRRAVQARWNRRRSQP